MDKESNTENNKENTNLSINDDLEPEEFSCQADDKINYDIDCSQNKEKEVVVNTTNTDENLKYTKVDCLDEDPPISGQKYFCISFISPEGLMNCKTRGFKIRGVFGSMSEAKEACKNFQKQDKYFDVFVAEVGKWCPWDPTQQQIKETVYKGKDQNQIMKNIQDKELKQLNEIVGRQKDKLDKAKVSHKERVANAMKKNVESFKDDKANAKNLNDEEDERAVKIEKARKHGMKANKTSEQGKENVRDRLRKNAETNAEKNYEKKRNQFPQETLEEQKAKLNAETQRIKEQESATNIMKQRGSELDEKISKLKEMLHQKKTQGNTK